MVALIPFLLALMGFGLLAQGHRGLAVRLLPGAVRHPAGRAEHRPGADRRGPAFRTSEREIWRHVVIPYTLPYLMTGVRQALARGLVGMIAAEFFLSAGGLGSLLITAVRAVRHRRDARRHPGHHAGRGGLMAHRRGWSEARFARWRVPAMSAPRPGSPADRRPGLSPAACGPPGAGRGGQASGRRRYGPATAVTVPVIAGVVILAAVAVLAPLPSRPPTSRGPAGPWPRSRPCSAISSFSAAPPRPCSPSSKGWSSPSSSGPPSGWSWAGCGTSTGCSGST